MRKVLLLIILLPIYISAQHGAYFAPVFKVTSINNQSAVVYGGKGGWIINKTFVIGGAFYGTASHTKQSWIDPINNAAPYISFNTGGLNLEYFFFRNEPFAASLALYLGGAGIKLLPEDDSKPFTNFYGGDFLITEPQLNASYSFNDWLHLSLGVSYRYASGFDIYHGSIMEPGKSYPAISINSLKGAAAVLSLVMGVY